MSTSSADPRPVAAPATAAAQSSLPMPAYELPDTSTVSPNEDHVAASAPGTGTAANPDSASSSYLKPPNSNTAGWSTILTDSEGGHSDVELENEAYLYETPTAIPQDELNEVLGFSISHAQSHMKSSQTPAIEKQAVMDEGEDYFQDLPTDDDEEPEAPGQEHVPNRLAIPIAFDGASEPEIRQMDHPPDSSPAPSPPEKEVFSKPSPWRSDKVQPAQRTDASRSILKDGLLTRRRSSSGSLLDVNLKKYLPNLSSWSMPKTPNMPSFTFGSAAGAVEKSPTGSQVRPKRSNTLFTTRGTTTWAETESGDKHGSDSNQPQHLLPQHQSRDEVYMSNRDPQLDGLRPVSLYKGHSRQSMTSQRSLRRSASESSIFSRTVLSRSSTLDDTSKWDHIQGQVNSRFQAIKDTLQDSSIRMPTFSSLNLNAFRPDFSSARTNSEIARRNRVTNTGSMTRAETLASTAVSQPIDSIVSPAQVSRHGKVPSVAMDTRKSKHPILATAISHLSGDVVVMGGYRGSILRSAKPPHHMVWVPVIKAGLNIRKVDLQVGLEPEDEERMEETIYPDGILSHIGPVEICRRLLKKLRKAEKLKNGELRVSNYGYDWRLSPHLLSRRLLKHLESLPCNAPDTPLEKRGALVIAHSLGGIITRHAVNQRPDLFSGVIYAGTPQHCINILGPLRNGDSVLFSQRVLTAQVNFTLRTSFVLLPENGHCFIDRESGKEYKIDFFDPKTWKENRLSPCIMQALPSLPSPTQDSRGIIETLSDTITSNLPGSRKFSTASGVDASNGGPQTSQRANKHAANDNAGGGALEPNTMHRSGDQTNPSTIGTTVTISKAAAEKYLARTLADTVRFKKELRFHKPHSDTNVYPPLAVIYAKNTPTVWGAKVASRDGIQRADAYDDLAFAAGDGVCLARAAMLPEGYRYVKNGLVRSERGHVGLLGDLESVGRAILAVKAGREKGVGTGRKDQT